MFSLSKIIKKPSSFISVVALIGIVLYAAHLIMGMIKPGHDWGGDFALYINQCVHLSNGNLNELYTANKFSMQNGLFEIGPYLYPQGFPILLLPIYWLFGIDLYKMKIYCALFFLASLVLLFNLVRPHFKQSFIPVIIIGMIGFSPHFIEHTDNILSEFPFIFFCLVCFFLMQKERTLLNQILLGLTIFFTYLIRDIGICLIAVLAFDVIFKIKDIKKSKYYSLVPFVAFLILFIISKLIFPEGGANHQAALFDNLSWARIEENSKYYTELLSNLFLLEGIKEHVGNKMLLVVLFGAILTFRKTYRFFLFILMYVVILLMWPSQESFRFLLPIIGFLFLFMGLSIDKIASKLSLHPAMLLFTIMFFLYPYFAKNIEKTKYAQTYRSNDAKTKELDNIYGYLKENIEQDKVIGFIKPRVLTLFTGHKSILAIVGSFDTSIAEYLLVPKNFEDQSRRNEFELEQDFENYYILSKKN